MRGAAAELAGVHPQTLRIYERKGLLDPARTVGGSRRYSDWDIARLRRIQDLTTAGLNLEGVRRVMELEAEVANLRAELAQTRRQAAEAAWTRLYRACYPQLLQAASRALGRDMQSAYDPADFVVDAMLELVRDFEHLTLR